MFNNKSILITGGTGSFGKKFVEYILNNYSPKRLIIFSRDELKQFEMSQTFSFEKYPCIRYFLGDVRNQQRLVSACQGVDIIVHAAALKQVPAAEYNPEEFIMTNVNGAQNIIHAALQCNVENVVALSTDKACAPINLYGATKLCSDKLFVAANNIKGDRDVKFSVVRYGNVMGSRGSVIPFFLNRRAEGEFPITDPNMTRFNITLQDAIDLVVYALENAWGGEIFISKIPSYKITDIAEAIDPSAKTPVIGIRPGEKIHEEMISSADSYYTYDVGNHYVIIPNPPNWKLDDFIKHFDAKAVEPGFTYDSGSNTSWLTIDEIRQLITDHVDSTFSYQPA